MMPAFPSLPATFTRDIPEETDEHDNYEDEDEDEDTRLTVGESSDHPESIWDGNIDPWKYPSPRRRKQRSDSKPCIDIPCLSHKRRVGKLIILWEKTNAITGTPTFVCVLPACWAMTLFTECLIVGISLLAYTSSLPYLSYGWWLVSFLVLLYSAGSLFKTATTDPGIVPRVQIQPDESWTWCERAQSYRAPGVVFCNESGILVKEMDHFCPWTGTTIAGGNIKYFYMFLSGIFIQMMYVVFLIFMSAHAKSQGGGRR